MKKLIFLSLAAVLVLSACGAKNKDNKIIEENNNMINEKEVVKADRTLEGQEDLAVVYDQAILHTNLGDITLKFYEEVSPKTVNNFYNLAKAGFYDGVRFHRVIPDFMIQTGDPNSKDEDWTNDGAGGPGYDFADEINENKLVRGSLAMANRGANTNGSQFFIVTAVDTPWLDGRHTNFGYVAEGMDLVDKINSVKTNENDHPLENIIIRSIELK